MDVRRLGPVAGVEEEPVGASPEHGRHAERCYPQAHRAMDVAVALLAGGGTAESGALSLPNAQSISANGTGHSAFVRYNRSNLDCLPH